MADKEVTEEELKVLEEELAKLDSKSADSLSSSQKDSVAKIFRQILIQPDTTRIGNVTPAEIGESRLSIRGCKSIAKYARVEGLDIVADYFEDQANIITEPSMSKKGFLLQTIVTQIKKEQKIKEPQSEKKKWFSKKPPEGGE